MFKELGEHLAHCISGGRLADMLSEDEVDLSWAR
jgi:hypothetical protein